MNSIEQVDKFIKDASTLIEACSGTIEDAERQAAELVKVFSEMGVVGGDGDNYVTAGTQQVRFRPAPVIANLSTEYEDDHIYTHEINERCWTAESDRLIERLDQEPPR